MSAAEACFGVYDVTSGQDLATGEMRLLEAAECADARLAWRFAYGAARRAARADGGADDREVGKDFRGRPCLFVGYYLVRETGFGRD